MIKSRYDHSSFTNGKKFFVIGGKNRRCSEFYDSISGKFTVVNKMLPLAPQNEFKTKCFNKRIVILCGCFCNKICSSKCYSKLHVLSRSKHWIKKEIVLEYNLEKANIHKIPKQ